MSRITLETASQRQPDVFDKTPAQAVEFAREVLEKFDDWDTFDERVKSFAVRHAKACLNQGSESDHLSRDELNELSILFNILRARRKYAERTNGRELNVEKLKGAYFGFLDDVSSYPQWSLDVVNELGGKESNKIEGKVRNLGLALTLFEISEEPGQGLLKFRQEIERANLQNEKITQRFYKIFDEQGGDLGIRALHNVLNFTLVGPEISKEIKEVLRHETGWHSANLLAEFLSRIEGFKHVMHLRERDD